MTRALDIDPEHLDQVRAILSAHLPSDIAVLVFGSRAKGGAKRYSDLDLALKGPARIDPSVLARLADAFEESSLPWRVDVVDYNALEPTFLAAIESDLVPLA